MEAQRNAFTKASVSRSQTALVASLSAGTVDWHFSSKLTHMPHRDPTLRDDPTEPNTILLPFTHYPPPPRNVPNTPLTNGWIVPCLLGPSSSSPHKEPHRPVKKDVAHREYGWHKLALQKRMGHRVGPVVGNGRNEAISQSPPESPCQGRGLSCRKCGGALASLLFLVQKGLVVKSALTACKARALSHPLPLGFLAYS